MFARDSVTHLKSKRSAGSCYQQPVAQMLSRIEQGIDDRFTAGEDIHIVFWLQQVRTTVQGLLQQRHRQVFNLAFFDNEAGDNQSGNLIPAKSSLRILIYI